MVDRAAEAAPTQAEAELALVRLREMCVDLRGGTVLSGDGKPLAATGDLDAWKEAAAAFLTAADAAAGEAATQAHVGTEDGEAFAVREAGLAMVAVAERFTLASLILFDMRSLLRDLVQ